MSQYIKQRGPRTRVRLSIVSHWRKLMRVGYLFQGFVCRRPTKYQFPYLYVCVTSGDMQMLRCTAGCSNELIKVDIPIEVAAHNGSTI